jgi:hypothetical protein
VVSQQYAKESWRINLAFSPEQFPLNKGDYIGLSGNTGGSAGPHVHFEIRDTKTEKVLNPLLFRFPIPDAVPPSVVRLALYDRNQSTFLQSPQLLAIAAVRGKTIRLKSDKVSFAINATDRFTGSSNPNGIYAAKITVDDKPVSSFTLDNISYDETRYMNAHIDYPLQVRSSVTVQHLTPLPGAKDVAYNVYGSDGVIRLRDNEPHAVVIEVQDANGNTTRIPFTIQYDGTVLSDPLPGSAEQLWPNHVNVFERENFELITTEKTMYDAVNATYSATGGLVTNAVSPVHNFLNATIPSHDYITVRIKPVIAIPDEMKDRIVIKNVAGSRTFVAKAEWQRGWLVAKFRQFGTFQAFIDNVPPTVNTPPSSLAGVSRLAFTPTDNFNSIKNFRAEVNGQWLRFTNDKGKTWIYSFDDKFPRGESNLKVMVEDEAGNVTERTWNVRR